MSIPAILKAGDSRVWIIENGASPSDEPTYMGIMKTGDPSWGFGDITPIKVPDPNRHNSFVEAASIRGAKERVTSSLMGRFPVAISTLLRLARKQCSLDVQIAFGQCTNPQDYLNGWQKLIIMRDVQITAYNGENWGALSDDEQNPANENVDISAEDMYEVVELSWKVHAASTVVREITAIGVCDSPSCGDECDDSSDGCEKVFAAMLGTGATPGTKPSLLYTEDSGSNWGTTTIDTLFSTESPSDLACIGSNVVVISPDSDSLHYANRDDILNGVETWYETFDGFVLGSDPIAIWSVDAMHTWLVGENGYIYFTSDPTISVTVQDAGVATNKNLADVHLVDTENGIAVGATNTLLHTDDGTIWEYLIGPEVGVDLRCCWMLTKNKWLIGSSSGNLWYTDDGGESFTNKAPSEVTDIYDIRFMDSVVGYMAAVVGANGYIYRTTNGGYSWYRVPKSGVAITANDRINKLATCEENPNVVWGGGLADDGADGIIVKGS